MKNKKEIFKEYIRRVYIKIKNIWWLDRNMYLFALEGMLITIINNIVSINNNNLFATRMEANNFELSLVTSLPQFVGMLVLIPGEYYPIEWQTSEKWLLLLLLVYLPYTW
ncbi:MAG TPA: hypothetical protein PK604_09240 [Acetivibrio clariflavus]|nr:hypothetical protein [Acetivibrio clariflavus]